MLVHPNQMAHNELSPLLPYTPFTLPPYTNFTIAQSLPSGSSSSSDTGRIVYIAVIVPIAILLGLAGAIARRNQRRRAIKEAVESVIRTRQNISVIGGPPTRRATNNVNVPSAPVPPPPGYRNNVRMVPFTHLPPNFDFSSRQVVVRSDFVIIKEVTNQSRRKPERDENPPPYNEAMRNFF